MSFESGADPVTRNFIWPPKKFLMNEKFYKFEFNSDITLS